jgi:hypothetical protein
LTLADNAHDDEAHPFFVVDGQLTAWVLHSEDAPYGVTSTPRRKPRDFFTWETAHEDSP